MITYNFLLFLFWLHNPLNHLFPHQYYYIETNKTWNYTNRKHETLRSRNSVIKVGLGQIYINSRSIHKSCPRIQKEECSLYRLQPSLSSTYLPSLVLCLWVDIKYRILCSKLSLHPFSFWCIYIHSKTIHLLLSKLYS